MINGILFDIDGTLMDTESIFYDSLNKTLEEFDLPTVSHPNQNLFGLSADEALNALGIYDRNDIKKRWEELFEQGCSAGSLYEGLDSAISQLFRMGCKVILVTSRSRATTEPILYDSIISPYILGSITANDTISLKPSPEPIIKAMEKYDLDPNNTIFVGDTNNDYLAAKAANIPFALAAWNRNANADGYNVALYTPEDLVNCVKNNL